MSKRNSPCFCGSNAKFKRCCGKPVPPPPPQPPRELTPEERAKAESLMVALRMLGGFADSIVVRGAKR